ncbi:MAG: hypothetical protein M0D57_03850 [Sphingobacteriales bacterium JAD_PAG50586_3]|nr:MAG: hypothetical protein M0D57_03850 [Sphingobacteriales bacterium JAD_PAG50586_3]
MKYKTIILVIAAFAAVLTTLALLIRCDINKANDIIESAEKEPHLMLDNGLNSKKYNYQLPDSFTYKEAYGNCLQVQKWSADMVDFIQGLKIEIIKTSEGPNSEAIDGNKIDLAKVNKKDDYDTPTKVMVGDDTKKGKAYLLHTKFNKYHKSLLSIMNPKDTLNYTDSLDSEIDDRSYVDIEDPEIDGWEKHIFYHTPLVAAIAHLSKLQADIRHDESVVINYFFMKSK